MDTNKKQANSRSGDKSNEKKGRGARFHEKHEGKLKEFFMDELKDIYDAEKQILEGLDKMAAASTSSKLKKSIEKHHSQTEKQVQRIEKAFELLDEKPAKKKCEAIAGILKEGESMLKHTEEDTMVRDVGIIISNQKVEHYEIATYGSLIELARTIGLDEVADLLGETLQEEKETDVLLTELAVDSVNPKASKE